MHLCMPQLERYPDQEYAFGIFSLLNFDSLHFDCRDMPLLLHSLSFQFTK